jgi:hypothetical protein
MMHAATRRWRCGVARLGAAPCTGMLPAATAMSRRNVTTIPTPTARMKSLRELMASQDLVRMLEVHNGLTALVSDKTVVHAAQPYCAIMPAT